MKITFNENKKMNHHELKITVHPKNIKMARMIVNQIEHTLDEIIVYDDYRNRYPIPIVAIYYIEMVDHKMFVYTERDIYRLYTNLAAMKEKLIPYGFFQINVRTLVNSRHIQQYNIDDGCRRKIILDSGDVLVSNRHYRNEFDIMMKAKEYQDKSQL